VQVCGCASAHNIQRSFSAMTRQSA
jgi:hypothetical protein